MGVRSTLGLFRRCDSPSSAGIPIPARGIPIPARLFPVAEGIALGYPGRNPRADLREAVPRVFETLRVSTVYGPLKSTVVTTVNGGVASSTVTKSLPALATNTRPHAESTSTP